jgi:hypothetical protein
VTGQRSNQLNYVPRLNRNHLKWLGDRRLEVATFELINDCTKLRWLARNVPFKDGGSVLSLAPARSEQDLGPTSDSAKCRSAA